MAIYQSANDLIGNTPLLELNAVQKAKGFSARRQAIPYLGAKRFMHSMVRRL